MKLLARRLVRLTARYRTGWVMPCSLCLLVMFISACAVIPNHEPTLQQAEQNRQALQVLGAKKPLSPVKVDKKINLLTGDARIQAALAQHLAVEQSIAGQPLFADNAVTLLFDGESTFAQMQRLISAAKYNIHLEYFTFEDVNLGGVTLKALLMEKLAAGVHVRLIYDAIGSEHTPPALFTDLQRAGAEVTVFHPPQGSSLSELNQRDHRKILVVDGQVAIMGGVNLSKTYQSKGSFRLFKTPPQDPLQASRWRDTDAMISGPVVAEIQRVFLQHWDSPLPENAQAELFPTLTKQGNQLVRVMATPVTKSKATDAPYYLALLSAIQHAEDRLLLNAAYFVPTEAQLQALIAAAQRGVQVDLLLPGMSDSPLSLQVQRSHYESLLAAGVNVYEMQGQVLHAKVVSIDGVWSVIGSSNLDYRSAGINAEVDVVILGQDVAKSLEQRFQEDLKSANRISLEQWRQRSWLDRFKQRSARLFERLL